MAADAPTTVVVAVDGLAPGLVLVDLLGRLALEGRRRGATVVVRDPSPELRELLDLAGLAEVVGLGGSGLQAGGQAEGREQRGVEEVLPGGDAPA